MDLLQPDPRYVIDTSSLIELKDRYPRDLAPGAWELVERLADQGAIRSVEDVLEELAIGDDFVYKWARQRKQIFVPLERDIQLKAKAILAAYPALVDTIKRRSSADPFVIALAELTGAAVVCEEDFVGVGHRPRIPNVCRGRSVKCVRLRDMFLLEKLVLVAAQ